MIFDCPVCGKKHSVPDNYDNDRFDCPNADNAPSQKTFKDLKPDNQLTSNNPLMRKFNTREDEARPATVKVGGPDYRRSGEKISKEFND